MTSLKLECPECGQSIEAPPEAIGQEITCPACAHQFEPDGRKAKLVTDKPLHREISAVPANYDRIPAASAPEAARSKERAESLSTIAGLFLWGSLLPLFLAVAVIANDGNGSGPAEIAAAMFGFGIIISFLAQLFHIRAALEKKG